MLKQISVAIAVHRLAGLEGHLDLTTREELLGAGK